MVGALRHPRDGGRAVRGDRVGPGAQEGARAGSGHEGGLGGRARPRQGKAGARCLRGRAGRREGEGLRFRTARVPARRDARVGNAARRPARLRIEVLAKDPDIKALFDRADRDSKAQADLKAAEALLADGKKEEARAAFKKIVEQHPGRRPPRPRRRSSRGSSPRGSPTRAVDPPLSVAFSGTGAVRCAVLAGARRPRRRGRARRHPARPAGGPLPRPEAVADQARAQELCAAHRAARAPLRPAGIELLRRPARDVMVVVSYGQILRQPVLDLPRLGCLNIHGSLLPRHRGASPIQSAILAGDARRAGVTRDPEWTRESTPATVVSVAESRSARGTPTRPCTTASPRSAGA